MVSFDFIHELFDKRQYELFTEEVLKTIYSRTKEDKYDFIQWHPCVAGLDYYETPLDVFYAEFSIGKSECQIPLKDKILDKLYRERKDAKNIIQSAIINDISQAIKIREQALKNLTSFINKFKSIVWLNDKSYILEELKIFKKDIVSLRKLLHLEDPKKLPNITAKPILEIDSIDPLSFIDPHFMQAFKKAEKLALGHLGKFPSATRCAAFCEILYVKKYLKQTKTRIITMNNFAKLKYDTDIKIALSPGKVKKAERDKHKTRIIGELPPLNRCF